MKLTCGQRPKLFVVHTKNANKKHEMQAVDRRGYKYLNTLQYRAKKKMTIFITANPIRYRLNLLWDINVFVDDILFEWLGYLLGDN